MTVDGGRIALMIGVVGHQVVKVLSEPSDIRFTGHLCRLIV